MREFDYADFAQFYDIVENSKSVRSFNGFLDQFFSDHHVKSILDMTCGTGIQTLFLHDKGYEVTASDLNEKMLEIARAKTRVITFHQADMINVNFNCKFDAIISIFNAIGHLSKSDFEKTLINAKNNLHNGGYYIFDIFNFDFMKSKFINHRFIDICKEVEGIKYVRFNHNQLDRELQIMHINQELLIQNGVEPIRRQDQSWDMQIYGIDDLQQIIERCGLKVKKTVNMSGEPFNRQDNLSLVVIAQNMEN